MDAKTIYTKTAKGLTQVNQKTQSLSRDLMKVLKSIDGKSNVETLGEKVDLASPALSKLLSALQKEGYVKVFEVKNEEPLSDFGGDDDDFDFTQPKKPAFDPNATASFKPSQYRTPASAGQVERATSPAPAHSAAPVADDAELLAALNAARERAQTEARARAEREAQLRARLDVEAKARRDAEERAMDEARRAQAAAENARIELDAKIAAEKRQRDAAAEARLAQTLTREQAEIEAEQQKALATARARAEAESQALAEARSRAEAEARSLAEARVQAEAAAKRQQQEFESAQRDLRQQLKQEIEAKVRAEMETLLKSDVEEGARAEVEAAIMAEARAEARRMLEDQLATERSTLARVEVEAKANAEIEAKKMLAEQEVRIRAEMEVQIARIRAESAIVEAEAKKLAEAQAVAAAKASAEFEVRLKAEEQARRAAEAEAETRKQLEAQNRQRLEARVREESEDRARVEAEMNARLQAEQEAKIQAQARMLIEQEMREKSDRESQAKFDAERRAREDAEYKALTEMRARESALREVAEQTAQRERIEQEAEARIAIERQGREKAEEKARADEEAEQRQREAQVARLKELTAQREHSVDTASASPSRRGKKKGGGGLRWLVVGLVVFTLLALGSLPFVPLGTVNTRLAKELAEWLHDDVASSSLKVALFPRPHVRIENLQFGKSYDAKAVYGNLYMDLATLFSERFVIDTMELSDVTITAEALPRVLKWAEAEGRGKGIEISNIALRDVKISVSGVAIDAFDADLKLDKTGKVVRATARARDNKWNIDVTPNKSVAADALPGTGANDPWAVAFSARGLNLPLGSPIPISDLTAKGTMFEGGMAFPTVDAKLFEGKAAGSLKISWKPVVSFNGEFGVEKLKIDQLTEVFTRDVSLTGKLDGKFAASGEAATVGALLDKPNIQGNFELKEGTIGNVDLVQVMRSPGSVGGQSKFSELTGQLRVADGVIHYEKLKLVGGVLLANGNVSVTLATSTLAGNVNSEIRSSVAQDRATFSVGGKVSRPALRRGG
ncbi:MAG: AsmA-like C-terminal region-containing protein [Betaproteobacteria bacterium]